MSKWQFTSEDKDEAVNGNWRAFQIPEDCYNADAWILEHADFPNAGRTEGYPPFEGNQWLVVVERKFQEFLGWLEEQEAQEETALDRLESYVNHLGNWSAFDGRQVYLSGLIEQVREEQECTS